MALDRVNRDVQPGGDLLVAQALAEQVDHLAFTLGQPHAFQHWSRATAHCVRAIWPKSDPVS